MPEGILPRYLCVQLVAAISRLVSHRTPPDSALVVSILCESKLRGTHNSVLNRVLTMNTVISYTRVYAFSGKNVYVMIWLITFFIVSCPLLPRPSHISDYRCCTGGACSSVLLPKQVFAYGGV